MNELNYDNCECGASMPDTHGPDCEKYCDDCGVMLDVIFDDDCGGHNVAELLDAWVYANPWRCCDCLTEYGRNCNTGAGAVSA